jgi:hypothetical protein
MKLKRCDSGLPIPSKVFIKNRPSKLVKHQYVWILISRRKNIFTCVLFGTPKLYFSSLVDAVAFSVHLPYWLIYASYKWGAERLLRKFSALGKSLFRLTTRNRLECVKKYYSPNSSPLCSKSIISLPSNPRCSLMARLWALKHSKTS